MQLEVTLPKTEPLAPGACFPPDELIFGGSSVMREIRVAIDKVARTNVPVLLQGEGGTGKRTIAEFIHHRCPGGQCPFLVAGNSEIQDEFLRRLESAFPESRQAESEPSRSGCEGTLLVREIGELTKASQRKLMHSLCGDSLAIRFPGQVNGRLRLISTSSRALERMVDSGRFLRGLFHSIGIVHLDLPALRDRREDIPQLVLYFWERYRREFDSGAKAPSDRLMELLCGHNWPGNIRELAGVVKSFTLLGSEEAILEDLTARSSRRAEARQPDVRSDSIPLKKLVKQAARAVEHKIILRTLRDHCWNRKQTARALNISYRALLYKAKEAGVRPKRTCS